MSELLNSFVIHLLSELQDRNFEVVLFLSSWSPVTGMRADLRCWEAVTVVLAAWIAQITRLLLFYFGALEGVMEQVLLFGSPLVLGWMCVRAIQNYHHADAWQAEKKEAAAAEQVELAEKKKKEAAGKQAAQAEQGEGGEGDQKKEPFEPPTLKISPWEHDSVQMAFIGTLICCLLVSLSRPEAAPEDNAMKLTGAILGGLAVAIVAVVAGTFVEKGLTDRRYLLAASVVFGLGTLSAISRLLLAWVLSRRTTA